MTVRTGLEIKKSFKRPAFICRRRAKERWYLASDIDKRIKFVDDWWRRERDFRIQFPKVYRFMVECIGVKDDFRYILFSIVMYRLDVTLEDLLWTIEDYIDELNEKESRKK